MPIPDYSPGVGKGHMLTVDFCSLENNEHTDRITQTPHSAEAGVRVAVCPCEQRLAGFYQARSPSILWWILDAAITTTCRNGFTPTCSTLDTSCCDAVPRVVWIR